MDKNLHRRWKISYIGERKRCGSTKAHNTVQNIQASKQVLAVKKGWW